MFVGYFVLLRGSSPNFLVCQGRMFVDYYVLLHGFYLKLFRFQVYVRCSCTSSWLHYVSGYVRSFLFFLWCDSSWLRLVVFSMGVISAQPRYPLACFVTFNAIHLLLLPCFHLWVATKSAATGESCEWFFIDLRDYFCLLISTFISPDAFMRGSDRRCRFGISASGFDDVQGFDQSFKSSQVTNSHNTATATKKGACRGPRGI